jgi:hypothetical protein
MTHNDHAQTSEQPEFQARVDDWLIACFGETIARDRIERNHRFIEESLELVQANGCAASEAHQLVDYVYGRPIGELHQEVGGVMNTLAALCLASGVNLNEAAETELARVWTKVEKIRAKQAAKPKHSPLPEATPSTASSDDMAASIRMAESMLSDHIEEFHVLEKSHDAAKTRRLALPLG